MRRKKESGASKIPWYFFIIVLFFMYDDIPSPEHSGALFKLIALVLVLCAIPFAFGQGHVVHQLLNSASKQAAVGFGALLGKLKNQ